MIPLAVMLIAIGIFRAAGAFGAPFLDDWLVVTPLGAGVMLVFTGTTHLGKRRGLALLELCGAAVLIWFAIRIASGACGWCTSRGDPSRPIVVTEDVHRFITLALPDGHVDSSCAGLTSYLDSGSAGLAAYRRKFRVTPEDLCRAVRRVPERYVTLLERMAAFDSVGSRVAVDFTRFSGLYPDTRFVPAYIVVGDGIAAGTTTLGRNPVILIGAELTNKTAGLEHTILHELMHVQQSYPSWGAMTGGPAFMRGTLLRHSIKEGAADFLVELVTGPFHGTRDAWAEAHAAQVWRDFQRDMRGTDLSGWLYNGWNQARLADRPPDLGYWIGREIVRAYYDRASDKSRAIRDILTIRDFDRFLRDSGYRGPQDTARVAHADG